MKILYAGDSPAGGPANYLLGILRILKADLIHIPPSEILKPNIFDAIILSDFACKNAPKVSQQLIAAQVANGAGLLMIGGWGSFSGPYGGWRGSMIEKILPVNCLNHDDRVHFPSGALMTVNHCHPMFNRFSFNAAPVICGLNELKPRKTSRVLLTARKIVNRGNPASSGFRLSLDKKEYPLLVIDSHPEKRIAALATDLAPHWCGGLVDWGGRHRVLSVGKTIRIEVGERYIEFVSRLLRWLAGGKC